MSVRNERVQIEKHLEVGVVEAGVDLITLNLLVHNIS